VAKLLDRGVGGHGAACGHGSISKNVDILGQALSGFKLISIIFNISSRDYRLPFLINDCLYSFDGCNQPATDELQPGRGQDIVAPEHDFR